MDRYQCLKLVYSDRLSSFFTKLPKNNMGVSWGCLMPPMMPSMHLWWGASWGESDTPWCPHVIFWQFGQAFSPNCQKITWGGIWCPHDEGCHGDPQYHHPTHPPPPTPAIPPPPTHPPNDPPHPPITHPHHDQHPPTPTHPTTHPKPPAHPPIHPRTLQQPTKEKKWGLNAWYFMGYSTLFTHSVDKKSLI